MAENTRVVSAFDAKTRLSEFLRETERGAFFAIERRGKKVARLVPPEREADSIELDQILGEFQRIREKISGTVDVVRLVREGRKA